MKRLTCVFTVIMVAIAMLMAVAPAMADPDTNRLLPIVFGYKLEVALGLGNVEYTLTDLYPRILYPESSEFYVVFRGKDAMRSNLYVDEKEVKSESYGDERRKFVISKDEFPGVRHVLMIVARKKVLGPFGSKTRSATTEISLVVKYNTPRGAPRPPYYFGE